MYHLRRLVTAAATLATLLFFIYMAPKVLNPTPPSPEEQARDRRWVDSSPYWLDRQTCRWLSLCGVHHVKWDPPAIDDKNTEEDSRWPGWIDLKKRWDLGLDPAAARLAQGVDRFWGWETAPEPAAPRERQHTRHDGRRSSVKGMRSKRRAGGKKSLKAIPDYVLKYAPLVHLYSGENFWPSDIAEHVAHMTPFVNGTAFNKTGPLNLTKLARLAMDAATAAVYLTSNDNVESRPEWLHSHKNVPLPFSDGTGADEEHHEQVSDAQEHRSYQEGTAWWEADRAQAPHIISDPRRLENSDRLTERKHGARIRKPGGNRDQLPTVDESSPEQQPPRNASAGFSPAPAVLILVDKGSGIVDAFWFFFYSFNLGQTVLRMRFGNHVGDWEHCMVRFENGLPRAMFLSEHEGGKAYAWRALEKRTIGRDNGTGRWWERPVIYSAVGSHALYALPGNHPYVLPFGLLADVTDKGPLWDPALNQYSYWYDYEAESEESWIQDGEADENANHFNRHARSSHDQSLSPTAENPQAETSWFHFSGPWGDELYPLSDERQWRLFGQYHYITGPRGPKLKNLARRKVCKTERCKILESVEAGEGEAWY